MPRIPCLIARGAALTSAFSGLSSSFASEAFDPVAATEAYIARMPAEARARSDAYFEGGYWLLLVGLIVTLFICWLVLRIGIAQRLRDAVESRIKSPFARCLAFAPILMAILWVLNLPLDIYQDYWREHFYGLSNQTFGAWFTEQVIGFAVFLLFASPIVAAIHSGIRKSPARWWVAASLATPFFILFFGLISPVFIAPLFNKYEPLEDPAVREPILSMARANGVPAENVYEFNASKQSKRVSANVSGALGTIRISLNDNLLARCPPEGVLAVMGHELGHYILNHVYERTVYLSLMFAAVFWFVHVFTGIVLGRRGAAWGIAGPTDLAAMPVLFAGFSLAMFLATPVQNSITRISETEADLYSLNAARQPDAMAEVFLMLSEYRKLKPGPLEELLFFSHPSGYNRILAAMRWKAENMSTATPEVAAGNASPQ
ncbi:MAG TPA: M48 family metallopeptidase [Opitutaceae bacterium]